MDFSETVAPLLAESRGGMAGERLGSERVGPYQCLKYRVRSIRAGKAHSQTEWAATQLHGFVVKTFDEGTRATTEYQNVFLGPQDPSLFEIPAGYQRVPPAPGTQFPALSPH
jgi:hypothetical protein